MYKAAAFAAAVAAALAYFFYLSPQPIFDYYSHLNITTHTEMALQSVSRQVVKKVLSVETEEVNVNANRVRGIVNLRGIGCRSTCSKVDWQHEAAQPHALSHARPLPRV